MKAFIAALALFVTACATPQPIPPGVERAKVPDLPAYYQERAKGLPPLTDNTMGTLTVDAATSSQHVNEIATKYNSLVDLYDCVKESINTDKTAKSCLDK